MIILLNSLYVTGPRAQIFWARPGPGPPWARAGPGPGPNILGPAHLYFGGGGGAGPPGWPPPGPGYNGPAWPCYHYYSLPTITIIISYHIYPYQYHIISSQKMGKKPKKRKSSHFSGLASKSGGRV